MLFAQPATLDPGAILDWHALCIVALDQELTRVHSNLANGTSLPAYLNDALPIGSMPQDADDYFDACKDELDLAAALALVAAAEAEESGSISASGCKTLTHSRGA